MENKNLYNWVFSFNPYNDLWKAVSRDHYLELFSNEESPHIIKSKNINALMEIIVKTDGDEKKIAELIA